MKILAISGSLRKDSYNNQLLRSASHLMPAEVSYEIMPRDLLSAIPAFNEDIEEPAPEAVEAVRNRIKEADGILIATPEYNHSLPGWLKNVIDWCSRPTREAAFKGKDVVVIGASTGMFGALWSQAETRKTLGGAGARVVDLELAVAGADEAFDESDQLIDPEMRKQLETVVEELLSAAEQSKRLG